MWQRGDGYGLHEDSISIHVAGAVGRGGKWRYLEDHVDDVYAGDDDAADRVTAAAD